MSKVLDVRPTRRISLSAAEISDMTGRIDYLASLLHGWPEHPLTESQAQRLIALSNELARRARSIVYPEQRLDE